MLTVLYPQGWTEIPITENPHALLGVICAGLCFMQPLIAMTRCHPDHRRRPIFNWVHWFVGNAAQGRLMKISAAVMFHVYSADRLMWQSLTLIYRF